MSANHTSPRRIVPLSGIAAGVFVVVAACVVVVVAAMVIFIQPTVTDEPDQTTVTVGGLHYSVNNSWILDPHRPVDAAVAEGLPRRDAQLPPGELLYAVFLGVTNETDKRLPMASDIVLSDIRNVEYAPARLAADNKFAYKPVVMAPTSHQPAPWTTAENDISAEGRMLVFRISRRSYNDGALQLVLRDPLHPAAVGTVEA
jgi:Co/Zn/Cd efflux system component